MINRLFVVVDGNQLKIDYSPATGKFRSPGGDWKSLRQSRLALKGTVSVSEGSNANPYACFHCSNCAKPIQAVRNRGFLGLRKARAGSHAFNKLTLPAEFIAPLNDGECWLGESC